VEQAGRATERKTGTKTATHTELARLYLVKHQDTMYSRGRYHRYDNGVWEPIHDLVLSREIWRHLMAQEVRGIRPSRSIKGSVLDCVQGEVYTPEDQLDANENLINMTNGVYDLQEQTLHPHSPTHYMTTQLPFGYDPNAQCITWQMYLLSTFVKPRTTEPDPELIEFVQEAMGYSLTTSVQHHVYFLCFGEGANGKGILFHVLEQLAGNACVPLNVDILKHEQYQLADLAGKRIALCSETSSTKNLVEDAYIKTLVAGDTMNVRQIRKEPFVLKPQCKLWQAANKLPDVADTSVGYWRRVKVVPFNREFAPNERILDMKDRLDRELPGIFNWCMTGLRRLHDRGRFVDPGQVKAATAQYRTESNPVELFIADECYTGDKMKVQSSRIYEEYKSWCLNNTYKPLSSRKFKHEMERLGYFHKPESACNMYLGVELRTPLGI